MKLEEALADNAALRQQNRSLQEFIVDLQQRVSTLEADLATRATGASGAPGPSALSSSRTSHQGDAAAEREDEPLEQRYSSLSIHGAATDSVCILDRKFYDESEVLSPSPTLSRGGSFSKAPKSRVFSDKAVPIARLSPNCLEFGELQIRITPSEFIGIRTIQDDSCDDVEEDKKFVYGGGVLSSRPSIDTSAINVAAREKRAAKIRQRMSERKSDSALDVESSQYPIWEVIWKEGGGSGALRRLAFEADNDTVRRIKRQIDGWHKKARHASVDRELHTLDLGRYRANPGTWEEGAAENGQSSLKTFSGPPLEIDCQEESKILTAHQKGILAKSLPKRLQMGKWGLLYSSDRNGLSLNTLYRCNGCTSTLLPSNKPTVQPILTVIKDTDGAVFGAFTTERWKVSQRFYGSGESFVFYLSNDDSLGGDVVKAFVWTRANSYFMHGSQEGLAIGSGGSSAFYIDGDLNRGSSGQCDTFGSDCLASTKDFVVNAIEIWSLS